MMRAAFIIAASLLIMQFVNCSNGNNTPPEGSSDSIKILRNDLNIPWEILWGKDDHLWITERGGKVSKIDPNNGNTVFSFVINEVVERGEGGLLGMVQHPEFLSNGFLYVVYNYNTNGDYREKVVRLKFSNNTLSEPLVMIDNIPAAGIHNGSRLLITPDNKLLITTGDASNSSQSQNTSSLSGKFLRLNLDGSIPGDNPIPNNPIWSIGHRNPQGAVIINGKIYSSEHGPSIEDELNIIEKGRNYGWPEVNGPCDGSEQEFCNQNNVATPIWSSGGSTLAVAGIDYYDKSLISRWQNSILMTTLKDATLYQLKLNSSGTVESVNQFYEGEWGRLRDVCVSPAGKVYICTSNGGGADRIVEIRR